jgi:hypothetical protein
MFYPSFANYGPSNFAATTATQAENAAREAQTRVDIFQHDIDRLLLITEALWTVIKQQQGYNDDVLVQLIQDIEKQRTTADGVMAKDPPINCPACGRPNTSKRNFCIYCGKPLPANPFAH